MKAYGKSRRAATNRTIPGTSRPCPCCILGNGTKAGAKKSLKKKARQQARKELSQED